MLVAHFLELNQELEEIYPTSGIWMALPKIWLGMLFYVLVYSAYTMLVSVIFGRPTIALLLGTLVMFAIWIAINIASFAYTPLIWLWLSSWYSALWQMSPYAYGVFILYLLGFIGLAGLFLRRVDL